MSGHPGSRRLRGQDAHLPELLRRCARGVSFTHHRTGAPVAELVPVGGTAQRTGIAAATAMRQFMQDATTRAQARNGEPRALVDVKALIAEGRD